MGIAFILRVLDLWKEFDSLHWFESVSEFFKEKQDRLRQEIGELAKKKASVEEQQHEFNQNEKRLKEYELLNYAINSARVFFICERPEEEKVEAPAPAAPAAPP